jgi:hypothetical protein
MTKKKNIVGTNLQDIHDRVRLLVSNNYPNCTVEFAGDPTGNIRRHTFGFRIIDSKGKYRTETIWIGPSFYNHPNKDWLTRQIRRANGTLPEG